MNWKAGDVAWRTTIRVYADHVVFGQHYDVDFNKTEAGSRDDLMSSFPSFKLDSGSSFGDRGYLSFQVSF